MKMGESVDESPGALLDYMCNICGDNKNFFVDFTAEISKIKSDTCKHFDIKFIYKNEGKKITYMISFNCKNPNCGKNQIVQLYPSNSEDIPSLHYKCPNCKCGDMNFQMILNEKAMKKKNKNINVNANINQSLYNDKVIGGNANQINNGMNFNNFNFNNNNNNFILMNQMYQNNMNNNIMFNNNICMPMNPNMNMNPNFNNLNMNPNFNNANMNPNIINGNINPNFNNANMNPNIINANINPNFINVNMNPNFNNQNIIPNFNNANMNPIFNNGNINIGNMHLNNGNNMNNINNNINIVNPQNQKNNAPNSKNSIILKFKTTEGQSFDLAVDSLDLVFSKVIHELFKKFPDYEDKIKGFVCQGKPIQNQKSLKDNNISNNDTIMIFMKNK